ncbi:MAG: hypothetical protein K8U57_22865, partial [Planctomycetes bacterium]|nr:hypothetical protein [Planctomycetota bacterium]
SVNSLLSRNACIKPSTVVICIPGIRSSDQRGSPAVVLDVAGLAIVAGVARNNTIIRTAAGIRAAWEAAGLEQQARCTDDSAVRLEFIEVMQMAEPMKPVPVAEPLPPDPYPDYPIVYSWFFQSWLIMFLAVICLALVFYLATYI